MADDKPELGWPDNVLVFLARHGQTVLNKDNCFRGPLNPDLDKTGYQQAHQLATLFTPINFGAVIHSDKKRAAETARIIHADREEPLFENAGLQAWNVGWFGGKPKDKYKDQLDHYVKNPDLQVPEGESLNDFRGRVQPLFQEAIELAMNSGQPILLVVHSSLIHEAGAMIHGTHEAALVKPGGVAAIHLVNGELRCSPIYLADERPSNSRSDTIS